jgi:hypothetical protein
MKRTFKQWWSTIPPISSKRKITFHLNSVNIKEGHDIWHWKSRPWLGTGTRNEIKMGKHVFIVCSYIYRLWRSSYQEKEGRFGLALTGLTLSYLCTCPKSGFGFPMSYVVAFFYDNVTFTQKASLCNIMKRTFKQWWSTIPPISSKRKITFHLNSVNIKEGHDIWHWKSKPWLGTGTKICLLLDCVCFEHVLPSFLVGTKSIELILSRKNNAKITMLVDESNTE